MTDFSYQLYSSRKFGPLADTLRMVSDLGYAEVEGYGALFADDALVAALKASLAETGLTMPTAHIGLDALEDRTAATLQMAKEIGIRTIYCPHVQADARPDTAEGWVAFGRRLHEAGKPFRDAGFGFGWHNHDFEFRALPDGTIPMNAVFEGAPDLEWEADIAWVVKGGSDPLKWIADQADRITAVHLKDIAPAGEAVDEDGWADLGQGTLDWQALMDASREAGAKHFVMEHDNPNDDARFARRSLAAARSY